MKIKKSVPHALAIYPTSRGFSFVYFESPLAPFDWGVKGVKAHDKNAHTLSEVKKLLERYRPDALILEDSGDTGSRRSSRIRRLYRQIIDVAEKEVIDVFVYPKDAVLQCFANYPIRSKYDIAKVIALHIEAFTHRLPPKRKIWQALDPRQSLFDAAALGLTFYAAHGNTFDTYNKAS
jgi:hypothetical protein